MKQYFAYGSNMSKQQLLDRCSSAMHVGIGRISGYELAFTRFGTYRPGGVASIRPASSEKAVYGVVWNLSREDLQELDRIEDPTAYERKTMQVRLTTGAYTECEVYIAFPEEHHVAPSPEYLDLIISAAIEAGLPHDYIAGLCDIVPFPATAQAAQPELLPGTVLRLLQTTTATTFDRLVQVLDVPPSDRSEVERKTKGALCRLMTDQFISGAIGAFPSQDDEGLSSIKVFPSLARR